MTVLYHGRVPRAKALHSSPVLRGFSRSVKQDSEASNASGGVSEANVDVRGTTELKLLYLSQKVLIQTTCKKIM
jgi:hypothetical protein